MDWMPITSAPKDGTYINLRGKWNRNLPGDRIEIVGHYDVGGFTEGWENEKGTWFCPDEWKPLEVKET